jgi:hypothetical protein
MQTARILAAKGRARSAFAFDRLRHNSGLDRGDPMITSAAEGLCAKPSGDAYGVGGCTPGTPRIAGIRCRVRERQKLHLGLGKPSDAVSAGRGLGEAESRGCSGESAPTSVRSDAGSALRPRRSPDDGVSTGSPRPRRGCGSCSDLLGGGDTEPDRPTKHHEGRQRARGRSDHSPGGSHGVDARDGGSARWRTRVPTECQRIGPRRGRLPLVPGPSGLYAELVIVKRASVRDFVATARENGGEPVVANRVHQGRRGAWP